jgi:hypothetical protein
MKRTAWVIPALVFLAAGSALAQRTFPDLIRLKDSETMRCYIISDSKDEVVVEFADAPYVAVTISRDQVEWVQKGRRPRRARLGARLEESGKAAESGQ